MSYEKKFKEITSDSNMGVYGLAELLGREADFRISELEDALVYFAMFACSPQGECNCNNCKARDVLSKRS